MKADEANIQNWDKGYEGTKKRQRRMGSELSPGERLIWLFNMVQLFEAARKK